MNNYQKVDSALGIVLLGQTPRPDVESLYKSYMPGIDLTIKGALDGLDNRAVMDLTEEKTEYPLWVVLSDGKNCEISLYRLIPFIERRILDLNSSGVDTVVLMCSGDFPDLKSPVPVIYPGRLVASVVRVLSCTKKIGVITPNAGQMIPSRSHWQKKGFDVQVAVASPEDLVALERAAIRLSDEPLDLIVMDCMGFGPSICSMVKRISGHRTLCSSTLVACLVAESIGAWKKL